MDRGERLQAGHALKRNIEDDDIRPELEALLDGFRPGVGFTDHGDVRGLTQEGTQTDPNDGLVIDE